MALLPMCWVSMILFAATVRAETPPEGMLLPYLAVGGVRGGVHFETLLVLNNPTRDLNSGVISVFSEDIQPLPIALNGDRGLLAEFPWAVSPGESRQFLLTLPSELANSGWIRINTTAKPDLDLVIVIRLYDGDMLVSQDGIIFPSRSNGSWPMTRVALQSKLPAWTERLWESLALPRFARLDAASSLAPGGNSAEIMRKHLRRM
jgi:hypothetical protein